MEPIDVNIYHLEMGVNEPVIGRIPGKIIEEDGLNPVLYLAEPNTYRVWHSDFDLDMLGIVYEVFDGTIEVIARRKTSDKFVLEKIAMYCKQKLNHIRRALDMFEGALGSAVNELTQIYKEDI